MKEDSEVINAELYLIVPISIFSVASLGFTLPFMKYVYAIIGGGVIVVVLSNYIFKMTKKYKK